MTDAYEKIDLPVAAVLADVERAGIRVDPKALDAMSLTMEKEVRRLEKEIWELAGVEFNVNSPTQLAEILFDKLNLQAPFRRGKGRVRSTAADVLEDLAEQHPMPAKVIEYREIAKFKSTYVDSLPKLIHRGYRAAAYEFFADEHGDGTTEFVRSEFAEHSDSDGTGAADSRGVCGGAGKCVDCGGLFADRVAGDGAFFERSGFAGSVSERRGHSRAHGAGSVWRGADGADRGTPAGGEGDQLRDYLWIVAVRAGAAVGDSAERGGAVYQLRISRGIAA